MAHQCVSNYRLIIELKGMSREHNRDRQGTLDAGKLRGHFHRLPTADGARRREHRPPDPVQQHAAAGQVMSIVKERAEPTAKGSNTPTPCCKALRRAGSPHASRSLPGWHSNTMRDRSAHPEESFMNRTLRLRTSSLVALCLLAVLIAAASTHAADFGLGFS